MSNKSATKYWGQKLFPDAQPERIVQPAQKQGLIDYYVYLGMPLVAIVTLLNAILTQVRLGKINRTMKDQYRDLQSKMDELLRSKGVLAKQDKAALNRKMKEIDKMADELFDLANGDLTADQAAEFAKMVTEVLDDMEAVDSAVDTFQKQNRNAQPA